MKMKKLVVVVLVALVCLVAVQPALAKAYVDFDYCHQAWLTSYQQIVCMITGFIMWFAL
ncbi:MAG: hypothetical protein NTV06_02135 [candidate division Zixibacteria bacterium]|nr:hypothetical protein [candidate division Zixibacteria bacterium]